MRGLLLLAAVIFAGAGSNPALAQMCGGAQTTAQAQSAASNSMCAMGAMAAPAAGQQQTQAQPSSGCSCCKNMAMMQEPAGGQGAMDGQGSAVEPQQDAMPNMQMPKQDGSGSPSSEGANP